MALMSRIQQLKSNEVDVVEEKIEWLLLGEKKYKKMVNRSYCINSMRRFIRNVWRMKNGQELLILSLNQREIRSKRGMVVIMNNLTGHKLLLWLWFVTQWKSMQLMTFVNHLTSDSTMFTHWFFLLREGFNRSSSIILRNKYMWINILKRKNKKFSLLSFL